MSDAPPAPGAALDVDDVTDAADAAEDVSDGDGSSTTVVDVMLHTEPDLEPEDVRRRLDVGPAVANGVIGVRKVIHAATGAGGESGTPALVNFGAAGYHAMVARDAGDDVDDEADGDDVDLDAADRAEAVPVDDSDELAGVR